MIEQKGHSILYRSLIPLVIVSIISIIATISTVLYIQKGAEESILQDSIVQAKAKINEYKSLRILYSKSVVDKVKEHNKENENKLILDSDYTKKDTFPLPATFIAELVDLVNTNGSEFKFYFYSDKPFPNRKNRTLDNFQKEAWQELQKDPTKPYIKVDMIDNKKYVRVAMPDIMSEQACINCHNSRPDTPKNDWKLGDLRGSLEVAIPINTQISIIERAKTQFIAIIIATITFILAVLVFVLRKNVIKPLNSVVQNIQIGANELIESSVNISQSAQSLSKSANIQASSVEEMIATINISTQTSYENSSSLSEANKISQKSNEYAKNGYVHIKDLTTSMENINNSSKKIANIIQTIDEIAFQTNLLALNAAVEAARAGEHGLGFAVVAEEVRSLASRSANAAKEIKTIINESINQVTSGNKIVEKTNDTFKEILEQIEKTTHIISYVDTSTQSQLESMQQISKTIIEIEKVTQNLSKSSDTLSSSSHTLNDSATTLTDSVDEISKIIGN